MKKVEIKEKPTNVLTQSIIALQIMDYFNWSINGDLKNLSIEFKVSN